MRDRLKRLERRAEGNTVAIPQRDGTVLRFPEHELKAAFINAYSRSIGEDVPEHPLSAAARNSTDPTWRNSVDAGPEEVPDHVEDFSQ